MEDISHLLQKRSKSYTFENFQAAFKNVKQAQLLSWFPRGPGQLREIHHGPQLVTVKKTCHKRQTLGNTSLMAARQYVTIQ